MKLTEEFITSNWEQDFEEGQYFVHLNDGDTIGYDMDSELFSLNNYWNEISYEEVVELIKQKGMDL